MACCAHSSAWDIFKSKSVTSEHVQDVPADLLGRRSIIALDGPAHSRVRAALNPTFAPKGLGAIGLGASFADAIAARLATWPARGRVRILSETRELVLSLMFRMMGVDPGEVSEWRRHYERTMWLGIAMPDVVGTPRWLALRSKRWLEERIRGLLAAHRDRSDGGGLLAAIATAKDDEGRPLDEEQIVDNVRLFLLAGHETSASTMAWAAIHCSRRDDVWQALCDEATGRDVPPTPAELKAFPWAEAVFREALRLHPPVSFDLRRVVAPLETAGVALPIGADAAIPVAHLSRDPALHPDPDRFDPTRWHGRSTPLGPAELVQFGAGPHFCLGYHLAWLEIVQFLVALARTLGSAGQRLVLDGDFPEATYIPITRPATDSVLRIV